MKRRTLLKYAAVVPAGSFATGIAGLDAAEEKGKEPTMKLRPHHLLDIVSQIGHGAKFAPHPYGHGVHLVAKAVLADVDRKVQFVVAADDVCKPCKHLQPNGLCDDIVKSLSPPVSKQEYNDRLDRRLLKFFGFPEGTVMTVREFLQIVDKKLPELAKICSHPKEAEEHRLKGLEQGLQKLGIHKARAEKDRG